MKRIGIVTCLAVAVCAAPLSVQAHGCEFFWAIPLALGFGAAIGSAFSSHTTYVYPQPAYVYAPPVYAYTYAPPAHATAPAVYTSNQAQFVNVKRTASVTTVQTVQTPRPAPQPAVAWTPRTTGAGHWVPDPEPYAYMPQRSAVVVGLASKPNLESSVTMVSGSPGDVRVYVVSR